MAKKSQPPNPFTGRWRIVSMSAWEDDYLDEEVEAFLKFEENGSGSFQFGYVEGEGTNERPIGAACQATSGERQRAISRLPQALHVLLQCPELVLQVGDPVAFLLNLLGAGLAEEALIVQFATGAL
jgi:hypothetical protein